MKQTIKKLFIITIILFISFIFIKTNNIKATYQDPETEFRAVWVSPWGGDANLVTYQSEESFKTNMNYIFQVMEEYNMNAIIFHVRTHNNALYNSDINPLASYWSKVDFSTFDPLEWVIEESHKRGIEFHAWMNPYRVSSSTSATVEEVAASYSSSNIASDQSMLLKTTGGVILNPGEEAVRNFLVQTVMEVIEKYDVDAIHFDDYFYANMGANGALTGTNTILSEPDQVTYEKTHGSYSLTSASDKASWRREQINIFIETLSTTIREYNANNNRFVQLGIAPTGIYRNGNGAVTYDDNGNAITTGSDTGGQTHYSSYLFCDTVKWCNEEWIDYILPQSYWATNHSTASFYKVMSWWDKVVEYKNVNLYSGIGLYMADLNNTTNWCTDEDELLTQLTYLTTLKNVKGASIYNFGHLRKLYDGETTTAAMQVKNLNNTCWTRKTLWPEIKSMEPVYLGSVSSFKQEGNMLTWEKLENAKAYAIYQSNSDITFSSSELVRVVSGNTETLTLTDDESNYKYGIKAISYTNTLGPGTTDNFVNLEGAQVRTEGNQGIRFVSSIDKTKLEKEVSEYGMVLAYGKVSSLENFVIGGVVNQKEVISASTDSLSTDNKFYITLYNIPTIMYLQEVTARVYLKYTDGTYYYDSSVITRSLAEVAMTSLKLGISSTLLESVKEELTTNYKVASTDEEGNYSLTTYSMITNDVDLLGEEFLKDYNEVTSSSLTSFAQPAFYNSARSNNGVQANANYNISDSKIYQFFNDEQMKTKWGWFLEYLKSVDNVVHCTRQIDAILNLGTNGDYALYYANHLCCSITNFFTRSHYVNGYTAIDFTGSAIYDTLSNYNTICSYSLPSNLVRIGSTISLPKQNVVKEGYIFEGYYLNGVKYDALDSYVVNEDVIFTATFKEDLYTNIGSFNIVGYKVQTATSKVNANDGIRLYDSTQPGSTLYWYKVALSKDSQTGNYVVTGIASSGEAFSLLPAHDYLIIVYGSDTTSSYQTIVSLNIAVNDIIEFSSDISTLEAGEVNIEAIVKREK